jgi:TonB family protein
MADKKAVTLKISEPDKGAREFSIEGDKLMVGSGSQAGLVLVDPQVEGMHCILKVDGDGNVTVIDQGTETGTFVDDKKIESPTKLPVGATLKVGGTTLVHQAPPAPVKVEAPKVEAKPEEKKADDKPSKKDKKKDKADGKDGKKEAPAGAQVIGAMGATALLFNEELAADDKPTETSKRLEVAQLWGDTVINIRHFGAQGVVKIGSGTDADFNVFNDTVGASLVLARTEGSSVLVAVPGDADVLLRSNREQQTKAQLQTAGKLSGTTLKVGLDERAMVTISGVSFIVRWVRPQKMLPLALGASLDLYFTKVVSVTFMAFIVMWFAIRFTDLGMGSLSDDLFRNPNKYTKLLITTAKPEKKKVMDLSGVKEGDKPKKDEGKFGKKEEKKADADPSKKGAPKLDPNKREEDRKTIAKAGLLAAFGKMSDSATSNVLGPGGLGTGINNAIGGLKGGAGQGDAHGVGGLGSRGTGPGGGGNGLGIGGLGTKGGGRGAGGYGNLDLGGKGKDTVRVVPGKTTVVGALSREEIERVIKRHQNEILFCYNTELSKEPSLAGKVAINFTIDGSGAIADASSSQNTTNNNNIEQCMLARIRRWKFPEPKGGGQVVVTYPWIFTAAGDGAE